MGGGGVELVKNSTNIKKIELFIIIANIVETKIDIYFSTL